jgi:hypothetical protein
MKIPAILLAGILLLALFFQCCPSITPEEPVAPPPAQPPVEEPTMPALASPAPRATPTNTPAPIPRPEPQHFSGQGQQVSPAFQLVPGLALFHMTHDGRANFAITLLNDRGEWVELLVNNIGPFDGGKAVGITEPGQHVLDISADGNWTVLAEQPSIPADAPFPPLSFSGHGQQVSPMFNLASGLTTFHMTHDGRANFAIVLLDREGNWVELLVNEIGAFDGGKAAGIREAGVHILDISADGNWTITIEQ